MLFVLIGVIFSLLIEIGNFVHFCSQIVISIVGKCVVVLKVNIAKNHGCTLQPGIFA